MEQIANFIFTDFILIMNISFTTFTPKFNQSYSNRSFHLPQPLKYDTVSFTALKKNQFKGMDYACVNKFKPPIEKFNSNEDLQNWAEYKLKKDYINKDFAGRQQETKVQRKAMLKEWSDYITKENDEYTPVIGLMIMSAVTKDLKPTNDEIPPVLNKGVLADTIYNIEDTIRQDKNYSFDLNKNYRNNLRTYFLEDSDTGETETKWVVITSKKNDPDNFDKNVDKLKVLSHKSWCTKSFNAEPYLAKGDFHVYLEKGEPKLGVRFIEGKVQEIQGELNNSKIPVTYLNTVEEHIIENNLELGQNAKSEIELGHKIQEEAKRIHKDLEIPIKENDTAQILEYFGISSKVNESGKLTISHYAQPDTGYFNLTYNFNDIGIDENKLFEDINKIEGNAYFKDSILTDPGNLEFIGKDASFDGSKIKTLGKIRYIGGNAFFMNSPVENLGALKSVNGKVTRNDILKKEDFRNIFIGKKDSNKRKGKKNIFR